MPRIRSVHPELCIDETLATVSATAERTFVRLWPHLDDEGRTRANTRLLKAACYPLHDDVTTADVEADLEELASAGLVEIYTVAGEKYLSAKPESWRRWQKPRHFYPSKLPPPASAEATRDDTTGNSVGRASDQRPTTAGLELVELRELEEGVAAGASDVGPTTNAPSGRRQRQAIIDQAITILVERHMLRHPTTSGRPERHRAAVEHGKRQDHTAAGHQLIHEHPTITPEQLADFLEPGTAPLTSEDDLVPSTAPTQRAARPVVSHTACPPPCDGHGHTHDDAGEWTGLCPGISEPATA